MAVSIFSVLHNSLIKVDTIFSFCSIYSSEKISSLALITLVLSKFLYSLFNLFFSLNIKELSLIFIIIITQFDSF